MRGKKPNGLDTSQGDMKSKTEHQKTESPQKEKPPLTPNKPYPSSDTEDWT